MFVKINNETIVKFPYTFSDLQQENPYSNYGNETNLIYLYSLTEDAIITGCQIKPVYLLETPIFDAKTHKLVQQSLPTLINNDWSLGWEIVELSIEEQNEINVKQSVKVREQRNQLLQQTDWTQLKDSPLTEEKLNQFIIYRQLLRDLSNQSSFPWDINWPQHP